MWPLLLDFVIPIAIQSFSKFMEDNSDEYLREYIEDLEYRIQTLEKKVRALQICFLIAGLLIGIGYIVFSSLHFF